MSDCSRTCVAGRHGDAGPAPVVCGSAGLDQSDDVAVRVGPGGDQLAAAGEVIAGRLRVAVQRSYTLAEVPEAFADFAAGKIGKLAARID